MLLREALQSAVKLGLVEKNVADFVKRPKKEKYQAEFYNKEELKELFEAIKGDALELVIHTLHIMDFAKVKCLDWNGVSLILQTR